MKIKDIWNAEWEAYRGMSVRWADQKKEFAGMLTGIITRIDDKSVSVLAVGGEYYNLHPRNLIVSLDNRTKELNELHPNLALEKANEYADAWEAKYYVVKNDEVHNSGRKSSNGRIYDVMKFIEESQYRVTKKEIVANVDDITDSEYLHAIRNLLSSKRINQLGKRRAATYGLPGREYETPVVVVNKTEKMDIKNIINYLKNNNNLEFSRADLREEFHFSDAEWLDISKLLRSNPNIIISGQKRATRYLHK